MNFETSEHMQLPKEFKKVLDNDAVALKMVKNESSCYKFLPLNQRRKIAVFDSAVRQELALVAYAPTEIFDDPMSKSIILEEIKKYDSDRIDKFVMYLPEKFFGDEEFGLAVAESSMAFGMLSRDLLTNVPFLVKAVGINGECLEMIPHEIHTRELVIAAIKRDGWAFEYINPSFYSDPEVVDFWIECCTNDSWSCSACDIIESARKIDPELLKNKKRAMNIVSVNASQLENLPAFQDESDIVLMAVSQDGHAIQFASDDLKNCRVVVFKAVCEDAKAIRHLPATNEFRNDVGFALEVLQKANSFKYFGLEPWGEAVRNDARVVQLAAMQDPRNIEYAGPKLRKFAFSLKSLWSNLMRIHFLGYKHAPAEMKTETSFTLVAVQRHGPRVRDEIPDCIKKNERFAEFMKQVDAICDQQKNPNKRQRC